MGLALEPDRIVQRHIPVYIFCCVEILHVIKTLQICDAEKVMRRREEVLKKRGGSKTHLIPGQLEGLGVPSSLVII